MQHLYSRWCQAEWHQIRIVIVSLLPAVRLDITYLKDIQYISVNHIHRDDIWRKICVVSLNQQHKQDTVSVLCLCALTAAVVCCLLSETVALSVIICPVPPHNFQKSSSTTQSLHPEDMMLKFNKDTSDHQVAPLMPGILTGQMRFCKKGNVS